MGRRFTGRIPPAIVDSLVTGLGLVACASASVPAAAVRTPTAAPQSSRQAPTPKPSPGAVQPESCGPLTIGQDGNPSPEECPGGRINEAIVQFFSHFPSQLLALGPDATSAQVLSATCHDLNDAVAGGTIPIVTTEAMLAFDENKWGFADGTGWRTLQIEMTNGVCAPDATPSA